MTLGQIVIVIIAGMLLAFLLMQIIGYETTIKDLEEDLYYARNQELLDLKDFEDSKGRNGIAPNSSFRIFKQTKNRQPSFLRMRKV